MYGIAHGTFERAMGMNGSGGASSFFRRKYNVRPLFINDLCHIPMRVGADLSRCTIPSDPCILTDSFRLLLIFPSGTGRLHARKNEWRLSNTLKNFHQPQIVKQATDNFRSTLEEY